MDPFIAEALSEARASFQAGGAPVGAVLIRDGAIIGRGRNMLYQTGDATSHAEMEAFRDAARRARATHAAEAMNEYLAGCDIYTTAMPCEMCTGTIIHFASKRVIVGECETYPLPGTRSLLERQGIKVLVLDSPECVALVEEYLRRYPERRRRWSKLP